MNRLLGKTAAETIAVMMAVLGRLTSSMRGSITFDNDTTFARHTLLRGLLGATTYFCDAHFFGFGPHGRKAASKTPTAASDDGCPEQPTSMR